MTSEKRIKSFTYLPKLCGKHRVRPATNDFSGNQILLDTEITIDQSCHTKFNDIIFHLPAYPISFFHSILSFGLEYHSQHKYENIDIRGQY